MSPGLAVALVWTLVLGALPVPSRSAGSARPPAPGGGGGCSVAVNVAEPEQQQARHLCPHGMYSASVGHILSWGPALSWSAGRAQAAVLSILQAHKSR